MAKVLKKVVMVLFTFTAMFLFLAPMGAKAEEERNVIYVNPPEEWKGVFAWAWDEEGNNAFASWPGEEMEADLNNEGWYYIWVPSWANHIIVNDGGEIQTGELISEGGNVWIAIADVENAEVISDDVVMAMRETAENTIPMPNCPEMDIMWTVAADMLVNINMSGQDVKESCEAAQKNAEELIRKMQ